MGSFLFGNHGNLIDGNLQLILLGRNIVDLWPQVFTSGKIYSENESEVVFSNLVRAPF